MVQVNKNFIKRLLSSKIFLFFISFALIGLAISVGRESYNKYQLTKEINRLKSEIERIEGRNQQLSNLMEYFKEGSYLEKEARLKLNLKKPNEKVIIISGDESKGLAENYENKGTPALAGKDLPKDRTPERTSEEGTNFWKWWEYFFQSSP
jgi:cell division protein FtsB